MHCKGAVPCQRFIPFAEVRNLSPEDFVQILAHDLQVSRISSSSHLHKETLVHDNTWSVQCAGLCSGSACEALLVKSSLYTCMHACCRNMESSDLNAANL